ncbi:MAG: Fic family protein [Nitrospira sp.]|nr:Fic family protein [Nitrospira sp.]
MSDPYVYPGTDVLINKRNIRDADALERFERVMSRRRAREPLFDLPITYEGYRAVHKHLFQDVYHWAGQSRTVSLAKGATFFGPPDFVESEMKKRFDLLEKERTLKGLRKADFAKRAAEHLGEINAIHPFREGNGRAQRYFLKLLARQAGHKLDLQRIKPEPWHQASVHSFHGKHEALEKIIRGAIVEPVRLRSRTRADGRER